MQLIPGLLSPSPLAPIRRPGDEASRSCMDLTTPLGHEMLRWLLRAWFWERLCVFISSKMSLYFLFFFECSMGIYSSSPSEKEHVCTLFIVKNTRFSCQILHILPHGIAPNRLFPMRLKKVKKGAFQICVFEPLPTKLQRPWVSAATSLLSTSKRHCH